MVLILQVIRIKFFRSIMLREIGIIPDADSLKSWKDYHVEDHFGAETKKPGKAGLLGC